MRKRILSFVLSAVLLLMPGLSLAEEAASSYFAGELTTTAISDSYAAGEQLNLIAALGLDLDEAVTDKTLLALSELLNKAQLNMSFYDDFGTDRIHLDLSVADVSLLTADALIYEDGSAQVMSSLTGKYVLAVPSSSERMLPSMADYDVHSPEGYAAFYALPAQQRLVMTAADMVSLLINHLLGWVSFTQMETGELYEFDDTYLEATELRDPVAQRMIGRIETDSFNRLLWNVATTIADTTGDFQQALADVLAERGVTRYQARRFIDSLLTEETVDPALDYVSTSYFIIENKDESPIQYDDVAYFFKKLQKSAERIWSESTNDIVMSMDVSYDDFGAMVGFDAQAPQFTTLLPYEGDFTYSIKTDDNWQRLHTSHGELQIYNDQRVVGDLQMQFGQDVDGVNHSHLIGCADVVNQADGASVGIGVDANADFEVFVNEANQDAEAFEGAVVVSGRTNAEAAALASATISGMTTVDAESFAVQATAALGLDKMGMLVADMQLEQGEYEEIAFAGGQVIDMTALDDAQKDMIKSEIKAQAAKLSLSLVTKPDVLANLMTVFGGLMK